jgi:hypothetical protein
MKTGNAQTATGLGATVGGGDGTFAAGSYATMGGGGNNQAGNVMVAARSPRWLAAAATSPAVSTPAPMQTWTARGQDPSVRHMGPMAQDFAAAFGVGEDDTHIATIEARLASVEQALGAPQTAAASQETTPAGGRPLVAGLALAGLG